MRNEKSAEEITQEWDGILAAIDAIRKAVSAELEGGADANPKPAAELAREIGVSAETARNFAAGARPRWETLGKFWDWASENHPEAIPEPARANGRKLIDAMLRRPARQIG